MMKIAIAIYTRYAAKACGIPFSIPFFAKPNSLKLHFPFFTINIPTMGTMRMTA